MSKNCTNTHCQYTRPKHCVNTLLATRSVSTLSQPSIPTHYSNTLQQHTLSAHSINTLCQSTMPTHYTHSRWRHCVLSAHHRSHRSLFLVSFIKIFIDVGIGGSLFFFSTSRGRKIIFATTYVRFSIMLGVRWESCKEYRGGGTFLPRHFTRIVFVWFLTVNYYTLIVTEDFVFLLAEGPHFYYLFLKKKN